MIEHFTSILLEQPITEEFERIRNNEELSSKNIPYTIQYVDILIYHYESLDEYEKCQILLNYKNNRISTHDNKFIENDSKIWSKIH